MKQIILCTVFVLFSLGAFAQKGIGDAVTEENLEVVIYPNPAVDFISIEHNSESVRSLQIRNIVGAMVAEFELRPDGRYDLSHLARGLYLVQVLDGQDQLVATRRLKKQ